MEFTTFVLLMMLSSVTQFRAATGAGTGAPTGGVGTGTGTGSGTGSALVAPAGHHMVVHYHCETNKDVTIQIKPNATYQVNLTYAVSKTPADFTLTAGTSADKDDCHQGLTQLTPPTTDLVLKACDTSAPLYLYFLKSRSKASDPVIFGGSEYQMITLDCRGTKGVNYTVNTTFTDETDKIAKESTENPDIKLDMKVGPKTNIHVGDIVTVTVTDSSDPLHYLAFADCQATDDQSPPNSIDLLTNGVSQQTDIIATDPIIPTSAGTATLDMYAFRFAKSTTVKVICTVKVCTAKCSLTKRKRRSVEDDKLHMLEVTYTITDATQTSGQDKVIGSWITMVTLLIWTQFL